MFAQERHPMTYLDQMGRWSVQVHRPGLLESGAPDEVEKMVLVFTVSAESWCL